MSRTDLLSVIILSEDDCTYLVSYHTRVRC